MCTAIALLFLMAYSLNMNFCETSPTRNEESAYLENSGKSVTIAPAFERLSPKVDRHEFMIE